MIRIMITCFICLPFFSISQLRYQWKYNTITHKLLQQEEQFSNISDSTQSEFDNKYRLLDDLFQKCADRLRFKILGHNNAQAEAVNILKGIDSVLAENKFFICIKTEFLSTALTPVSKKSYSCHVFNNNKYREDLFKTCDSLYTIDCDLGSFLFLGVGEILGLPLTFVEVPKHNFVRWRLDDNTYFNWDVNSAEVYSDDEFRKGLTPTVSTTFTKKQEAAYRYLTGMDSSTTMGYYSWVIGRNLKKQKKYQEARKYYELAIPKWNYHPNPKLSLAYMIVFYKIFNSKEDFMLANKLAGEVVNIYPDENEHLETLACSYALLGNFNMAIQTINKTHPLNTELKKAFKEKKTGVDIYKPID